MIDLISVDNMRESDASTIASETPGLVLMERAALGIYRSYAKWDCSKSINIVTGSGNNGGDGFALALILEEQKLPVTIFTMSEKATEDAGYYKNLCVSKGIRMVTFGSADLDGDIIVDCMLGTGFKGVPRDNYRNAIEEINNSGAYVICADINSGMNGDTGEYECCVRSDLTVTIGYLKKGLITPEALKMTGKITVADIGIALNKKEASIDETSYGISVITVR